MARTLVGVYDSSSAAQQVRDELLREGFDDDEVSVRYADDGATGGASRADTEEDSGGILGFFRKLFDSDDDEDTYVNRYNEAISGGRAVVSLHTDSEESVERAQSIMNRYNPVDIDVDIQNTHSMGTSGTAGAGAVDASDIIPKSSMRASSDTDVDRTIPVVEEDLQVGKRVIAHGGVRVITRIQERPVEESIRLREEHARVERTPVDRPATEADFQAAQAFEIRETAEEPVVAKQARVVEEVRVGKDVSERTETIRDTVRHTDVQVEKSGIDERDGNRDWDTDYRTHWQSQYASSGGRYEDYEPAYRYGATLRGDTRYSGRDWAAVEPDVRRDWEAREPGTWEKIKDSVRYGWERVTH